MNNWLLKLEETFITTGYYKLMLDGLKNTVVITIGALAIGVIIGTLIAAVRYLSEGNKVSKFLVYICDLYVTVIRGIPVCVLLLVFYYIILKSSDNGVVVGIITFGINSGAYMAEIIRGGILAVDKGQDEAGRSLGLSRVQTMKHIILPQAVRYILPSIGNEFISLLKETSVAGYVAVVDLTRAGNLVRNNTFDAVNSLLIVAFTYLLMVIVLTFFVSKLEKKLAKGFEK